MGRRPKFIGSRGAWLSACVLLGACGGSGHSQYTTDAQAQAAQRMDQIKSATEWDMARQRFEAGDLEKALEAVDRSLALNSEVASSYALKGRILLEMGRTQSAMNSFDRALAIEPEHSDAQFYRAVVLERIGRFEEALEGYKAASAIDPENTQYLLAATEMLMQMDRLDEAEAFLDAQMEFHQYDPGIHQTLAHISMLKGDRTRALEHFNEAAVLAPDDAVIVEDLALAEIEAGQFGLAETRLARLIDMLEKDGQPVRRDLRHLRLRCLLEQDRVVDARREVLALTKGDEGATDVTAWATLGALALRTGDSAGLRAAGERLIELRPDQYEGYYYIGLWRHATGDPAGALPWLDDAIALSPGSPSPSLARSLALIDLGRPDDAARDARAVLSVDPTNREAGAILAAIGR